MFSREYNDMKRGTATVTTSNFISDLYKNIIMMRGKTYYSILQGINFDSVVVETNEPRK